MSRKIKTISVMLAFLMFFSLTVTPGVSGNEETGVVSVSLRVEGAEDSIYSGEVTVSIDNLGETSALDVLRITLDDEEIDYVIDDMGWGMYLSSIDGEDAAKFGGWDGWLFMVNGAMASVGAADYMVNEDDHIVFFYGNYPPDTLIPEVEITPSKIFIGQNFSVNLTSTYYDWGLGEDVATFIEDADVMVIGLEGAEYTTDENGQVVVSGIEQPGEYVLSVSKNQEADAPAIVRTGDSIIITVHGHDFVSLLSKTSEVFRANKNLPSWAEALIFRADGENILDDSWTLPTWSNDDLPVDAAAIQYPGVIIGLITTGKNPANIWGGRNLVRELLDKQDVTGDFPGGLNSTVWAMIALDMALTEYDRTGALNHILENQKDDGGFVFFGENSDPDSTAMVLIVLSNYMNEEGVEEAVSLALDYLEDQQEESAAFSSWGSENANSTAVVLSALVSVGESIYDARWIKDDRTIVDALLDYRLKDGSFSYLLEPLKSNDFANKDALMALSDLAAGNTAFYRHGFGFTRGDVIGDDSIHVGDAIATLRQIVGLTDLDYFSYLAADINGDGIITVSDTIRLLRYLAGLETEL